jgi:hypothetical protein
MLKRRSLVGLVAGSFLALLGLDLVSPGVSVGQSSTTVVPVNQVRPVVECREVRTDGQLVWFGYQNDWNAPISIPVDATKNKFNPLPVDRGQPSVFAVGRQRKVFSVAFASGNQVWTLKSPNGSTRTATASPTTALCPAVVSTTVATTTTTTTLPVMVTDLNPAIVEGAAVPKVDSFFSLSSSTRTFRVDGTGAAAGASVAVVLRDPLPQQAVSVALQPAESFRANVAGSAVFGFELVGDQTNLVQATLSFPFSASIDPSTLNEYWVAYRESDSDGLWIPEENPPSFDVATRTVSVVSTHFSERVLLKGRPIGGAWTNEFLDAMFGPFPSRCVPASVGALPGGRVAFVFDTSGSMAEENRDVDAAAIARSLASATRSNDLVYVYHDDNGIQGGRVFGSQSNIQKAITDAVDGFGGTSARLDLTTKDLIEVAEDSVESPANILRHIYLFTDSEGFAQLYSDSFFSQSGAGSWTNLESKGIRLTVVHWPTQSTVRSVPASPYLQVVAPSSSTATQLSSQLRVRLATQTDTGVDTDGDGLTNCEEANLFFPNPNFPGGSVRNPVDAPSVFFSHTNAQTVDSDGDGTNDGAEISRRKLSGNVTYARAFANLILAGTDEYFVAKTGRPDARDTDGDTLADPAAPLLFESCDSGDPSPLKADTDGDGARDDAECTSGTDPESTEVSLKANPWAADYLLAQQRLNGNAVWRGAQGATGFGQFTTTKELRRIGRIRLAGFIPQDQTATTPCVYNIGVRPQWGFHNLEECTGYLGDNRPYSNDYQEHQTRYLQWNRAFVDLDFRTGVYGIFVHPTCERGTQAGDGACYNSFPIKIGDLTGLFRRPLLNLFGQAREQMFDIKSDSLTNVVSLQGKLIQNDTGVESNVFRPGADFRLTVRTSGPNFRLNFEADGFPAFEAFHVHPNGVAENLFDSEFAVKTAPSPFALAGLELGVVTQTTECEGRVRKFIASSQGCVALEYEVEGYFD